MTYYGPLKHTSQPLAPDYDFDLEIVKQLSKRGLIFIRPESDVQAFDFDKGEYTVPDVLYTLASGDNTEAARKFINRLENTFRHRELWPYQWQDEILALWRKIALHECLVYLRARMKDHNLELRVGEKTHLVLSNVLQRYSTGQAYCLIYRAVKDAAAFYMRGSVTKPHAANTVIGAIQRDAERRYAEGWETKTFGRDWDYPESVVSQVLFNTALQIGEAGFNEIPRADLIGHDEPPTLQLI